MSISIPETTKCSICCCCVYIVTFFSGLGSYIQRTQSIKLVNINYRKISQTDESLYLKHNLFWYLIWYGISTNRNASWNFSKSPKYEVSRRRNLSVLYDRTEGERLVVVLRKGFSDAANESYEHVCVCVCVCVCWGEGGCGWGCVWWTSMAKERDRHLVLEINQMTRFWE